VNRVGILAKRGEGKKWRDANESMLRYYLYYHLRSFLFILSIPRVAMQTLAACNSANSKRVFSIYYFRILLIPFSLYPIVTG